MSTQWLLELHKAIEASYNILDNLKEAGHPYKRLSQVVLNEINNPVWIGESATEGRVEMNPDLHDVKAIAHEIGHGFEERWRRSASDIMGQSMAEAIRFFVEQKMGKSKWKPRKDWCIILDMCDSKFERFKQLLDGDELHLRYLKN